MQTTSLQIQRGTSSKNCLTNLLCTSNAYVSNPKSFSNNLLTPSNVKELQPETTNIIIQLCQSLRCIIFNSQLNDLDKSIDVEFMQ